MSGAGVTEVAVILEGETSGELERTVLEIENGDGFDERVDNAVSDVIEGWVLSIGDTIRIVDQSAQTPHAFKQDPNFADCCTVCGESPTHELHE